MNLWAKIKKFYTRDTLYLNPPTQSDCSVSTLPEKNRAGSVPSSTTSCAIDWEWSRTVPYQSFRLIPLNPATKLPPRLDAVVAAHGEAAPKILRCKVIENKTQSCLSLGLSQVIFSLEYARPRDNRSPPRHPQLARGMPTTLRVFENLACEVYQHQGTTISQQTSLHRSPTKPLRRATNAVACLSSIQTAEDNQFQITQSGV